MPTVSEVVIRKLESLGIKHIFFLPGGGCMYLVDALAQSKEIEGVALLHEQSVGIAAEAYAQFSNSLTVCLVTTGPGVTNILTPCAAAWTDSTPMLFISGQVKTEDDASAFGVRQLGFQEVPTVDLVSPITKMAVKLDEADEIHKILETLVHAATSGRPGPVWLDIPLDLQNVEVSDCASAMPISTVEGFKPTTKMLDQFNALVESWFQAKRPLLLVGNGVRLADQEQSVREIMIKTKTPALLTWKMIDFLDENDPLNAGRPGAIGQRWSNILQQEADFILCLGARMDRGQVAYRLDNFAPKALKFICEIDENEIKKLPDTFSSFNIDLSTFVSMVNPLINERHPWGNDFNSWFKVLRELKSLFPLGPSHQVEKYDGINLYDFVSELSLALNKDDILVPGSSGACSEVVMQAFKVKRGQRVLNSEGLGPMGFGLPASIGVALASKSRVVSVDGDGGFLMNIQELVTVAHRNLPLLIFVLNNNGYGSIKSTQKVHFAGRLFGTDPSSGLGLPDWSNLIRGNELNFTKVDNVTSLVNLLSQLSEIELPCVVEVIVDKNQVTEPRVATRKGLTGRLTSDDMKDMTPALSPDLAEKVHMILHTK